MRDKLAQTTEQRAWMEEHYGALSRIGRRTGKTAVFVGDVFYGRRRSAAGDVEGELAKLGAPGFEEYLAEQSD